METTISKTSAAKTVKSVNPFNGRVEKTFDIMSPTQVEQAIANSDKAFRSWRKTGFAKRAELLKKVASNFRKNREEMAWTAAVEMGKIYSQGLGEVELCARILEYYAANAENFLADRELPDTNGSALLAYDPIGPVLSIQPWNFPFYQVIRNTAPNLMAGNTVLLKHSSTVPRCAELIDRIFIESDLPKGVFGNLVISGSAADELLADERVKGVTFTGGIEAGSSLASSAGRYVKPSVIELGGNDAMIVLEDADMEHAVRSAALGRLQNAGQVCTSPKRVIVVESIADEFIEQCYKIYEKVKVGDPLKDNTVLGPLSSVAAMEKVLDQVERTVAAGALLAYGGRRLKTRGALMQPTILTDIEKGMPAYEEEIFGPVLSIYIARDEADALRIANDSRYGLGGSVFSGNRERAEKVAREMHTGMVFINEVTTSLPQLPFGGVGQSGYGRELSQLGIYEFVNPKLIAKAMD